MWDIVRALPLGGVTIILTRPTTSKAEEMADRIGVMHKGRSFWSRRRPNSCKLGKNN
jgi:ABC-type multidrug transport system ATPase subunit